MGNAQEKIKVNGNSKSGVKRSNESQRLRDKDYFTTMAKGAEGWKGRENKDTQVMHMKKGT